MEYESTDFHADDPEHQNTSFGYAVYFKNIRHTLNTKLKIPIKKNFSTNCQKYIIQVTKPQNNNLSASSNSSNLATITGVSNTEKLLN